jgi:putative DNA primase/helicase
MSQAPQREILIRTLAASLDLAMVKKFRSRVKALLCKGDGNNGKDSIREAVDLLYGIGVTGCAFSDFQQYDEGRKFPLAKLAQSRVNWSSENSNLQSLDRLQCLKKAISGEDLDFELKGGNDRPMKSNCVFFFNINSIPNLQASMEAIKSRYAVLTFDKTFKVGADPTKGELEADPRFRYDPEFIRREVVPSLLNKMLAALPEIAMNGIDYSCTDGALQEIREESTHLARFAREVGLEYQVGGRVYINDLWEKLCEWYIANGTLVITNDGKKEKQEWHDQPRRGDKNVKALNQIYQRFHEIFPKVRRERETHDQDRVGQSYLSGLVDFSAL